MSLKGIHEVDTRVLTEELLSQKENSK